MSALVSASVQIDKVTGTEGAVTYTDSSFGKTPFPFGGACIRDKNALLAWFARKAKEVADSSCYAELSVICAGLKESIFVNNVKEDMGEKPSLPVIVTDSKAAYDII